VNTLAPAAEAPTAAAMAVCSPSTLMYSAFMVPFSMRVAMWLMSSVCGVIGYAGTTSALASLAPHAAASLPSIILVKLIASPP